MFESKKNGRQNAYSISVYGDSISTYQGFNPPDYKVYYKDCAAAKNDIRCVDDTWWKQVIDAFGAELCVNNSYSGSMVAEPFEMCACSDERCFALHGDTSPDIILIYLGTNDRGFKIKVGADDPMNTFKFYGGYREMLKKLKRNYPSAKIVCATLLMGRLKEGINIDYDPFMYDDQSYNDAIRAAVNEAGCLLADIALFGEKYETLDYCHPTRDGHATMARLWLNSLKALI